MMRGAGSESGMRGKVEEDADERGGGGRSESRMRGRRDDERRG